MVAALLASVRLSLGNTILLHKQSFVNSQISTTLYNMSVSFFYRARSNVVEKIYVNMMTALSSACYFFFLFVIFPQQKNATFFSQASRLQKTPRLANHIQHFIITNINWACTIYISRKIISEKRQISISSLLIWICLKLIPAPHYNYMFDNFMVLLILRLFSGFKKDFI